MRRGQIKEAVNLFWDNSAAPRALTADRGDRPGGGPQHTNKSLPHGVKGRTWRKCDDWGVGAGVFILYTALHDGMTVVKSEEMYAPLLRVITKLTNKPISVFRIYRCFFVIASILPLSLNSLEGNFLDAFGVLHIQMLDVPFSKYYIKHEVLKGDFKFCVFSTSISPDF